jgi:tetratricopeptide (TPR) repeat protein
MGVTTWLVVLAAALWTCPSPGIAQPNESREPNVSNTEALIESYEPSNRDVERGPLPQPQVSQVSLQLTWRNWRDALLEGNSNPETLTSVRQHARELGRRNAIRYGLASLGELQQREALEALDASMLAATLTQIESLTPALPFPHLARVRLLATEAPSRVSDIVGSLGRGLRRAVAWPNTRVAWGLDLALSVGLALLVAFALFVLGQSLRHLGPVARDLQRLLPSAFSKAQVLVLLLLAVVAPAVVYRSPLLGVALLLLAASPPQHWRERLVSTLLFGCLALLPTIDDWIDDAITFQGSDSQQLLEAQYLHCDNACLERLDPGIEGSKEATDGAELYTWALARLRHGHPGGIERALHRLQEADFDAPIEGYAWNLTGAALLARGRSEAALDPLERAAQRLETSSAPLFNIMRAHQKRGNLDASQRAFERAVRRDVAAVSRARRRTSASPPSFLMLEPLPATYFWERHRRLHDAERPLIESGWRAAAGPHLPFERAPLGAAIGGLVLLIGGLMRLAGRVSTPCPNCGMAREPGDPEKTRGDPRCYPCFRTFFGGGDLQYDARRHYEEMLERRARLYAYLRRGLSLVAPGTGHVVAGHAIGGVMLATTTVLGALWVVDPTWAWQPPHALFYDDWLGTKLLGGACLVGAALAVTLAVKNDIAPHADS